MTMLVEFLNIRIGISDKREQTRSGQIYVKSLVILTKFLVLVILSKFLVFSRICHLDNA